MNEVLINSEVSTIEDSLKLESLVSQYFSLNEEVAVYVPSTINISQSIDNSYFVNSVARKLSDLFGGATVIEAKGYYVANNGSLIAEKVNIVKSFAQKISLDALKQVFTIAESLKTEMTQEAISVEYNNRLIFV